MNNNKLRQRHEIPVEDTWALEHLFASDACWEAELETLKDDQALLASYAGKIGESAENLLTYLTEMERVDATHRCVRFCTSWATKQENVEALCAELKRLIAL